MAINIRKVGEVADGSVTSFKLADGAVVLESSKVTGELPSDKLADSSIVESKLAALSISTEKLKDNVVTLAKADNDVKAVTFIGDETELSVTGVDEVSIKEFSFVKKSGAIEPKRMRVIITLKTNDVTYTATAKVYVNGEVTARTEFNSTSLTYELNSDDFDISDLVNGKHLVSLKLKSSDALGIAYNDYIDVLLVK